MSMSDRSDSFDTSGFKLEIIQSRIRRNVNLTSDPHSKSGLVILKECATFQHPIGAHVLQLQAPAHPSRGDSSSTSTGKRPAIPPPSVPQHHTKKWSAGRRAIS